MAKKPRPMTPHELKEALIDSQFGDTDTVMRIIARTLIEILEVMKLGQGKGVK